MEFQGMYLSYIGQLFIPLKHHPCNKLSSGWQNCWRPSCYVDEDFQMSLFNINHDCWRQSFEKPKQQKVKIRKYGAMFAKVCGKEVAGFFWCGLLHKIPNVNKNHRSLRTGRTMCCIKHGEDNYQRKKIKNLLRILYPFISLISMQCKSTQQKGHLPFIVLHFFPFPRMWWEDLSTKVKIMNAKKQEVKIVHSQA